MTITINIISDKNKEKTSYEFKKKETSLGEVATALLFLEKVKKELLAIDFEYDFAIDEETK